VAVVRVATATVALEIGAVGTVVAESVIVRPAALVVNDVVRAARLVALIVYQRS